MMAPDDGKRCFTYCGDDRCNCPAREAHSILDGCALALPVLATMCRKIGCTTAAAKADEMLAGVKAVRGK